MRYIVTRVSPTTDESWTMHYASRANVIRYGLARPDIEAGQFLIWGDDGIVTPAYKRA